MNAQQQRQHDEQTLAEIACRNGWEITVIRVIPPHVTVGRGGRSMITHICTIFRRDEVEIAEGLIDQHQFYIAGSHKILSYPAWQAIPYKGER